MAYLYYNMPHIVKRQIPLFSDFFRFFDDLVRERSYHFPAVAHAAVAQRSRSSLQIFELQLVIFLPAWGNCMGAVMAAGAIHPGFCL
jgi:hypothetical protein